ncbi:hypothetical protein TYRP_020499, partial [Tyrophagus putrescentiae]
DNQNDNQTAPTIPPTLPVAATSTSTAAAAASSNPPRPPGPSSATTTIKPPASLAKPGRVRRPSYSAILQKNVKEKKSGVLPLKTPVPSPASASAKNLPISSLSSAAGPSAAPKVVAPAVRATPASKPSSSSSSSSAAAAAAQLPATMKASALPKRRIMRRSMSYESIPKMKNKATICQPITTVQRRLAVSRIKVHFRYKDQHLILICLAMISFTSMLAMAIIAPFFPKEAAMKGMPESVNGMVFSVYALVLMLFSPLMSVVIPMVGTKLTLIMGVFVAAVANILFGLLDQVHDLRLFTFYCFLVRIFEAIGATAFSTATYTILMEEFPKNIGTAFSIVETSVGLGLSLGPAIGGFLYSIGGYGLPFFVLGGIMLATIPMCVVIIRDSTNYKAVKSPLRSYLKLLSNFKILINGFVIVVVAQLLSFLDPTLEPHLRLIGLAPHYVSLAFLIMSATYTLSSPVIGWISNVVHNKFQLMSIGLFLLGIEFVLLGPSEIFQLETSFTQTAVTMAFIGVSYSIAFIPTFETLLALSIKNGFPDDIGTYSLVSGIWSSFCSFGEILGPVFGGFLTESYGFKSSSTGMGVCAFVMAIICSITCIYFDELKPYKSDKGKSTTSSKYGTGGGSSGNSTSVGLKEKRGTGGGKLRTTSKAVNGEATPLLLA